MRTAKENRVSVYFPAGVRSYIGNIFLSTSCNDCLKMDVIFQQDYAD